MPCCLRAIGEKEPQEGELEGNDLVLVFPRFVSFYSKEQKSLYQD
jgi:hypothetical protein